MRDVLGSKARDVDAEWEAACAMAMLRREFRLFPYQEHSVRWMLQREFASTGCRGGILGDEVGLGKTVQMLALIKANPRRTLICVPPGLVVQWREHIEEWLGVTPLILQRTNVRSSSSKYVSPDECRTHRIVVCTHTAFCGDPENTLLMVRWGRVIFDEAHRFKRINGAMLRCASSVHAGRRWCLTATPIINKRVTMQLPHCPGHATTDFAALLMLLLRRRRNMTFKIAKQRAIRLSKLASVRQHFLYRRAKDDVRESVPALNIPDIRLSTVVVPLCPDETRRYATLHAVAETFNGSRDSQGQFLKALLQMKMACALMPSKLRAVSRNRYPPGSKVLVFCNYREEIDRLRVAMAPIGHVSVIDGRTKRRDTEGIVQRYKTTPDTSILLINYRAGGVGLNLQGTTHVELSSPSWAATDELQAIGRAHRAYTTVEITVRRYVAEATIEQFVHKRQESKLYTAAALMNDSRITTALPGGTWPENLEMLGHGQWNTRDSDDGHEDSGDSDVECMSDDEDRSDRDVVNLLIDIVDKFRPRDLKGKEIRRRLLDVLPRLPPETILDTKGMQLIMDKVYGRVHGAHRLVFEYLARHF